mmetsp:Transcript_37533/g.57503  ORF Transcript_37533/g.57503 Transcript_37533/m.57503 type:complete len:340 (-) Transcript_37533:1980-2999(-)
MNALPSDNYHGEEFQQHADEFIQTKGGKKSAKKAIYFAGRIAGEYLPSNEDEGRFADMQIQMSKLERAYVIKVACSNKHSLAVTNTGAVFSWGENEFGQLGYNCSKDQGQALKISDRPRRIEQLGKSFIIDAACGDNHSLALSNDRACYVWGSNHQGQLGLDKESYHQVQAPKRIQMTEYMNSSNTEGFTQIHAKATYSILVGTSKNVYVTDRTATGFFPVFGKSPSNFHFKKLETQVYPATDAIFFMDSLKSIFRLEFQTKLTSIKSKHLQDKRIATEIYSQPQTFIELHPTERDLWAVNSMRQLFVCKDYKSKMPKGEQGSNGGSIAFQPFNEILNV